MCTRTSDVDVEPCQLIACKPYVIDCSFSIDMGVKEKCPTEEMTLKFQEGNQTKDPEKCNVQKTERTGWLRYLGIILALAGTMVYSLATTCIIMLEKYDAFSISFWRFQGILLPAIPFVIHYRFYQKKPIYNASGPLTRWDVLKLVLIMLVRSFCGCTSTLFQIFALGYISMPDTSVIYFSVPVFVSIVAHIYLGERFGFTSIFTVMMTICGVAIISRPPLLTGAVSFDTNVLTGTAFALSGMIMNGIVFVLLRYLRKFHVSFMMFTYGLIGTLESAIAAGLTDGIKLPDKYDLHLIVALIFLTFMSQVCWVNAFKFENAGPVSLMVSLDVIFAFVWQFLFWGISPDIVSVCGALLVIACVVLTGLQKWVGTLPEGKNHKMLKYLLK